MRPFFSYYGGKWRAAPRYPGPVHDTIVEPFAGSAGYSTRYYSRRVILCDIDPVICGVWRYILGTTPAEILELPDVPDDGTVDDLEVCQEARWWIGYWLGAASMTPRARHSPWSKDPEIRRKRPGKYWGRALRSAMAKQQPLVAHWELKEGDYREVLDEIGTATWFVDPPYQGPAGRHYRHDSVDYDALAEWCRTRQGQVIACDQQGAEWLPFRWLDYQKTSRSGQRSAEAIWTKGGQGDIFDEVA